MSDQPTHTASAGALEKPPRCAMCRARMTLARSEPDPGGGERCTYACPKCEFVKTKVIGGTPDLSRHRPPKKTAGNKSPDKKNGRRPGAN